jgi:hypothetical protein
MFEFLFLPHRDNFGGDWETTHKSVSIPEGGGRRICNSSKKEDRTPLSLSNVFHHRKIFCRFLSIGEKNSQKDPAAPSRMSLKPTQTFS